MQWLADLRVYVLCVAPKIIRSSGRVDVVIHGSW
jgi:hypothetical protein